MDLYNSNNGNMDRLQFIKTLTIGSLITACTVDTVDDLYVTGSMTSGSL